MVECEVDTNSAVPHRLMSDDFHNGYFIPKGTLVIPNIRHMLHDPRIYPHPEKFDPERFLGSNAQPDPRRVVFGFGRRTCVGSGLADASIYISCAMALAVFHISSALDDLDRAMLPDVSYTQGTIRSVLSVKLYQLRLLITC